MKKIVQPFLLLFFCASVIVAQQKSNTSFIKKLDIVKSQSQLKEFLELSPSDNLVAQYESSDESHFKFKKYKQFHQGIPVYNGQVSVHTNPQNESYVIGTLMLTPPKQTEALISKDVAVDISKSFLIHHSNSENSNEFEAVANKTSLIYIDKRFPKRSGEYTLAYAIDISDRHQDGHEHFEVIVNAIDGKVINYHGTSCSHNVQGKGQSFYYGEVDITIDSIESENYILRDFSRGNGIFIKDRMLGQGMEHENSSKDWNYESAYEQTAIDALYCTEKYYDFLLEKFNRNSIDDNGLALICNINNSVYPFSNWQNNEAYFSLGDCTEFGPSTSLDIVAHEFTHGLTQHTSNLTYQGEPGAINEAISDIFGEALEYNYDRNNFSWLVGDKQALLTTVTAVRSFKSPNDFSHPSYYQGKYWHPEAFYSDNGGVHTNSSVINHWFYLLVEGSTGVNEGGYAYNVSSIGWDNALELIYLLQTSLLNTDSDFKAFYNLGLFGAEMLFGLTSSEYKNVKEAFQAVGLTEARFVKEYDFEIETSIPTSNHNCLMDYVDSKFKVYNYGNAITKGTEVVLKVLNSAEASLSYILEEDLNSNEFIEFDIDLLNYASQYDGNVPLTLSCTIGQDVYSFTQSFNLPITQDEFKVDYSIKSSNRCFVGDEENVVSLLVSQSGCKDLSIHKIRYSLKNESNQVSGEAEVYPAIGYESAFLLDVIVPSELIESPFTRFDFIYDIIDENEEVVFNGEKSLLYRVNNKIEGEIEIDFSEDNYSSKLYYLNPYEYSTHVENELLQISGRQIVQDMIPECVPYELFKDYINSETFGKGGVGMCVNVENMIEPILEFDMRYKYEFRELNADEKHHSIFVKAIFGDEEIAFGDQPNTSWVKHKVELPQGFNNEIILEMWAYWSDISIDNIRIYDNATSRLTDVNSNVNINVYPNPVGSNVDVIVGDDFINGTLSIVDVNGINLRTIQLNNKKMQLDLSELPAGVLYFSFLDNHGQAYWEKVIHME